MEKRNEIKTWQQGRFVDQPRYQRWTREAKQQADAAERLLVRPSPLGNAICQCVTPADAEWIAARLNRVAALEAVLNLISEDRPLTGEDARDFRSMAKDALSA